MKDSGSEELVIDFNKDEKLSRTLADTHENLLPKKKLIVVFLGLALAMFLSFVDQTAITVALPYIADELDAQETISWAGTSSLISNTVFMGFGGRLSDIFSRKYVLIGCLITLGLSDLSCGFAQTAYQLYIFRGFCGMGAGGISSLTMVIVSDVVTLEQRGFYQGILGSCVGLGAAIGPFLASAFITHQTWRKFYYAMCPMVFAAAGVAWWLVPYTHQKVNTKEKLLQVDYIGIFTSATAIIFLLIPISGGGSTFSWNSALVIAFLTIGSVSMVIFIIIERLFARLPIIPTHLFTSRVSLTLLLSQNFFFGICHYSLMYYGPYYFQTIRGYSLTLTSLHMLSFILPQVFASVSSGQIISRTKHYMPVIWFGYISWTLGIGLLLLLSTNASEVKTIIPLVLIGLGVGSTFQPTLVAVQAQSYKRDRSTVISARNLLRSFGGAVGLAISSTILSNSFIKQLKLKGDEYFTPVEIQQLSKLIFSSELLNELPLDKANFLKELYMTALKNVFYMWLASISFCFISTLTVRDRGLEPISEKNDSS
jgi:MFS family permease